MKHPIDWKKFMLLATILWFLQSTSSVLNTGLYQIFSGQEARWLAISIYSYSTALMWLLLTPCILWVVIHMTSGFRPLVKTLTTHIIFAVLIAMIHRLITIYITYGLILWTEAVDLNILTLDNFFGFNYWRQVGNGIVVYFVIVGIILAYLFYRKNQLIQLEQSKLQAEFSRVQLENLTYQLQPHFIFNSLQSVSTLMHRDLEAADQALGNLGDLLRHSIRNIREETILLGEELFYLQKYTDLQKTRYGDNFSAHIEFDQTLMETNVPTFFLQPIVENSIKHGIEKTGLRTEVWISSCLEENDIVFTIRDNGANNNNNLQTKRVSGIGLNNLKSRLKALYGDKAKMVHGPSDQGYLTSIRIPITE